MRTRRTEFVRVPDRAHFLMCPAAGLFEPAAALGHEVAAGSLAGIVYDPEDLDAPPSRSGSSAPGRVVARRLPALTRRGDFLFTTALTSEGP